MKKKILMLVVVLILIGASLLYGAGDLIVQGQFVVGSDTPDSRNKLDLITTSTATGLVKGGSFVVTQTPASAGFSSPRGVVGDVKVGGANWNAGSVAYGLSYNVLAVSPSSGHNNLDVVGVNTSIIAEDANLIAGDIVGMRARVGSKVINEANITADSMTGFKSVGNVLSGTTVTDVYGMFIEAPTAGTITNEYGIWLEQQTRGTNRMGIVLDGDGAGTDIVFGPNQEARIYSSSGELFVEDGASNVTQISPHDPETGEWIFYSKNKKTGKVVKVEMGKLVKAVEKLTGETFMIESLIGEE